MNSAVMITPRINPGSWSIPTAGARRRLRLTPITAHYRSLALVPVASSFASSVSKGAESRYCRNCSRALARPHDAARFVVVDDARFVEFRQVGLVEWDVDTLALIRQQLLDGRLVFFRGNVFGDITHLDEVARLQHVPDRLSTAKGLQNVKHVVERGPPSLQSAIHYRSRLKRRRVDL